MPSFTPFTLPNAPTDGGVPLGNLAPRMSFGDAHFWSRPEGEVKACRSVSVRLIAAPDASGVDVAYPVALADIPTPWADLGV